MEIRRFGSRTHRKFVHIRFAEENSILRTQLFDNMRIINRHNISKHFRRAGSQQAFGANVVLDSAGNTGQRRDSVTGGDFRIDFGRLRQSVFFIQRHIGSDLVLNSVDALIQGFSQFHGADFFIYKFIM